MSQVASFLNPKSVVVIGVSREKDKIGRIVFDQLSAQKENVYGVNPHAKTINQRKIYTDVTLLPLDIELAVYATPADGVVNEVEKAAKRGIKNHLIISSGFKESGPEGLIREKKLQQLIKTYKISIQGPNCLGNISPVFKTNISFGATPLKGSIGLILQSGAIGTAFLDWAKDQKIGISHFVSLGNKIDLSENDFLEFEGKDKNTKAIGLYLEGLKDPQRLLDLAKEISRRKPVVVLSAGKTKEAKVAISSHTGALAGSFASSEAAFSQVGIIEAQDLQQFFLLLELLGHNFPFAFSKTLVITNAGGPSVLLADNLASQGFTPYLPDDREKKKLLNQEIGFRNPLDLLGDANPARLKKTLDIVPNLASLLLFILLTPQENTDLMAMARIISDFQKKFKGTLIVNLVGGERVVLPMNYLKSKKIIVSTFIEDLVSALIKIRNYLATDYAILKLKKAKIILQKKVEADAEVIVGAKKDPEYGHLLAFGSGGIHVEYLRDIKFAVVPYFSYQTLETLFKETKISSFLENPKKLWPVFVSLINLLYDFPQIEEVDLNPVMIGNNYLRCVDVKIKV
ncbi:acetate--CoA ligase family protein [Candidatus Gottesmanbacteria bacterium]|nr:acetate--CoA ligase family protein [Candidatus Gottesmanbacteria bacterium]